MNKIRITEEQVKSLVEYIKERALDVNDRLTSKWSCSADRACVYHYLMEGLRVGLLEVAENPEEVDAYIWAWREDK
jgi:hypothetical protein